MLMLTGYGPRSPEDLKEMCEKHEARAVDIRIRPYSKRLEWCIDNLRTILPGYLHLREFGNKARFGSGGIEINDVYAGAEKLKALEGNLLLFCACGKPDGCHRTELAKDLEVLFGIRSKEITWPKYIRPLGHYWNRDLGKEELDTLAAMEEWCDKRWKAKQLVETARFHKLLAMRKEYRRVEVNLVVFLGDGPLPDCFKDDFALKIGASLKTFEEVLRRVLVYGSVEKFTENVSDTDWLMYRLKGAKNGDAGASGRDSRTVEWDTDTGDGADDYD